MAIRVVVQGATGRMGREVVSAVSGEPDLEIVGAVAGRDHGPSLSLPDGRRVPLSTDLAGMLDSTRPDVLVDFTHADVLRASVPVAAERGVHIVTGTSGLSPEDLEAIDRLAGEKGVGVFLAPNFALGAVVLQHLARIASRFFDWVEIVEAHHEGKIDAPSGTAVALARAIAEEKEFNRNETRKENLPGSRGAVYRGVTVHAVRLPGRSAHHEVIFGAPGQTLSIRHDTLGRDCYMPGVVMAIRRVGELRGLVVGLDKLLGI